MTNKKLNIDSSELIGIDFNQGMLHWEDYDDYYQVLNVFAEKRKFIAEEINALNSANQHQKSIELAHAVKGMAGNLYLPKVFETALKLELSLKNSNDDFDNCIHQLRLALTESIQSISKLPDNDRIKVSNSKLSIKQLTNVLTELENKLQQRIVDSSVKKSLQLLDNLLNGHDNEASQLLRRQVMQFEHDEARQTIKKLENKYGI